MLTPYNTARITQMLRRASTKNHAAIIQDVALCITFLGDVLLFGLGMKMAYILRFQSILKDYITYKQNDYPGYWGYFIFGLCLFAFLALSGDLYRYIGFLRFRQVCGRIGRIILMWVIVFLSITLSFNVQPPISRAYVLLCGFICTCILLFWRLGLYTLFQHKSIGALLRQKILMIGWNEDAQRLAEMVQKDKPHPFEIVGCLPSAYNVYNIQPPSFIHKLGDYNEVEEIINRRDISIVIVADLDPSTKEILALSELCGRKMVQFKVIPSYFQILLSGLRLENISGVPVLGLADLKLTRLTSRIIKRAVDIVGAVVGLSLFAPIMVVAGAMIYLESPGPILFRQRRLGRGGVPFTMYKLRSMRLDAAKTDHLSQSTLRDDPRILKIGSFLRKSNIDEMPQFWNVLIGEMSLSGPRPERLSFVSKLEMDIPYYNTRHNIKPGITGWAQVHGLRGDTDLKERIRYDLYYMENWSMSLDILILIMTVFRNKNAY